MKVLDLSDWQENPNWYAIAKECSGVIIKISEGRTPAELFAEHVRNAITYNLAWGVYCLTHAQTEDRAIEEAEVVINILKDYEYPELGVWYDIEPDHAELLDNGTLTACASAFISRCNRSNYSAGIYADYYRLKDNINVADLANYVPYWCSQYDSQCNFLDLYPCNKLAGWQFTDSYYIDGQPYDMNEWY